MASTPFEQVQNIFAAVMNQPPQKRSAYLAEACGEDTALRQEVESLLDCAEPSTTPRGVSINDVRTGKQIGPYRILEHLAHGGMGSVYKAEQRTPVRRIVALKLIKPGFDSSEVIARFESERQALARMDHPNVAKVLDGGTDDLGRPYFVMEYVPGLPVTQFADNNKLTVRQRLELFMQACDAVGHAHTKALIHRDIKPSNVLACVVDGKSHLKVIDFGIAKALTGDRLTERTFNTMRGQPIGTIAYMSPEQADGSPDIDTRTDVYSLGVLLYELLAGVKPIDEAEYAKAGDSDYRRMIREVDPPRPSTRLSSLPADAGTRVAAARQSVLGPLIRELRSELEWVPLKAMRKERDRRYASPAQLAQDLANYLAHRPLMAGPESRHYRLRKFVGRNQARIAVAAILLFLFAASGVAYIHGIQVEQHKTKLALGEAEKQRQHAARQEAAVEQQRKAAIAANMFLARTLTSGDPSRLYGDKVTVLQAVQAVVRELDSGQCPMDELTEASVRNTVGTTLVWLSHYSEAEPNIRRAVVIRRRLLPTGDPESASTLANLARVLVEQDKLGEAVSLYRERVRISVHIGRADDLDLANDMVVLADLQVRLQQLADAESTLRGAVDVYRRVLSSGHPIVARNLRKLANLILARSELNEPESMLREAVVIFRKAEPTYRSESADAMVDLADLLSRQRRHAEAVALYREGLDLQREPKEAATFGVNLEPPDNKPGAQAAGNNSRLAALLNSVQLAFTPAGGDWLSSIRTRRLKTARKLADALTHAGQLSEASAVRREFGLSDSDE